MPNRGDGALAGRSGSLSDPDSVPGVQGRQGAGSTALGIRQLCSREVDLDSLPNDLTRLLYLASLRDCNSGRYLHPELSHQIGAEETDRGLSACHCEVFQRLLTTPISGYVRQLEEYIRYTSAESHIFLKTWQSLQAYRATVPLLTHPISSELFCLNIESALAILQGTNAPVET
jgi:hypothetical protein